MVELRPHQIKAIEMIRDSMRRGNRRVVLGAACSFGKTLTAGAIAESAVKKGKRVLFVCDRIQLVNQTLNAFDSQYLRPGVIQGEHWRNDPDAAVQIASVQTLARRRHMPGVDLVIQDECHVMYKTMRDMMQRLDLVNFIGLSATPMSKGMAAPGLWQDLVVPITTAELQEQGYLCPIEVYGGRQIDVSKVRSKGISTGGSDYDPAQLSEAVEQDQDLVGDVVSNWLAHCKGRQTIAFSASIAASKSLVELFLKNGIPAAHIDGYMDPKLREELMQKHDSGEIVILSCSQLLDTGYDAPQVSACIDLYPTKSIIRHCQKIGRLARICEGKENAIVLDHAGNHLRHGFTDMIVPERLDDGTGRFDEKKQVKKEKEPKEPRECPSCKKQFVGLRCNGCGYEIVIRHDMHGDKSMLKKLNREDTRESKQELFAGLLYYARAHGYKEGYASYAYREKYGVWPNQIKRGIRPKQSQKADDWVKHLNIKRAKSKRYGT
jgi:superfamily II DNA or RNA helicase